MTTVLAIAPHLDDAAFSVGGTLARRALAGETVVVATCFTGNVVQPTGFALACQLDKGLAADVDYMALRRAEDHAALAVIGARAVHLPFLEAPHRGYADAAALFGPRLADDTVGEPLVRSLQALIEEVRPDLVMGPLALGDHVDHHIVRDAIDAAIGDRPLQRWEDWPYLDRDTVARPDRARATATLLTPPLTRARIAMCAAYASQLGYQFGGVEGMTARLREIFAEYLHPA